MSQHSNRSQTSRHPSNPRSRSAILQAGQTPNRANTPGAPDIRGSSRTQAHIVAARRAAERIEEVESLPEARTLGRNIVSLLDRATRSLNSLLGTLNTAVAGEYQPDVGTQVAGLGFSPQRDVAGLPDIDFSAYADPNLEDFDFSVFADANLEDFNFDFPSTGVDPNFDFDPNLRFASDQAFGSHTIDAILGQDQGLNPNVSASIEQGSSGGIPPSNAMTSRPYPSSSSKRRGSPSSKPLPTLEQLRSSKRRALAPPEGRLASTKEYKLKLKGALVGTNRDVWQCGLCGHRIPMVQKESAARLQALVKEHQGTHSRTSGPSDESQHLQGVVPTPVVARAQSAATVAVNPTTSQTTPVRGFLSDMNDPSLTGHVADGLWHCPWPACHYKIKHDLSSRISVHKDSHLQHRIICAACKFNDPLKEPHPFIKYATFKTHWSREHSNTGVILPSSSSDLTYHHDDAGNLVAPGQAGVEFRTDRLNLQRRIQNYDLN